jgi:hypothetical protein
MGKNSTPKKYYRGKMILLKTFSIKGDHQNENTT